MTKATAVSGIVNVVRHGATGTGAVAATAAAVRELALLGRTAGSSADEAARMLSRIRATTEWQKGARLEVAAERWLGRNRIGASRNTNIDLLLADGAVVRPDFFAPGALQGALLIGESKNRAFMPLTRQLRQYVAIAQANDVALQLFMPRGSKVSKPLQALIDAGQVRRVLLAAT